jgi:phosphoribosylformylglycinamidine synthase
LVLPRKGTISPWASKAQDISKICFLDIERIEKGTIFYLSGNSTIAKQKLHDRMTQQIYTQTPADYFTPHAPKELKHLDLMNANDKKALLIKANSEWGLALAQDEITYLIDAFTFLKRNPTDVELMMFAQVNSEHCRHKIFGATWDIDTKVLNVSLMDMIRNTFKKNPEFILSAYSDNAAVLEGQVASRFMWDQQKEYKMEKENIHTLIKVETHNHPTAVSPFPGAATGSGGEIRDEAAVGRGSKTKAGLTGFSVSNLEIPDFIQPWEVKHLQVGKPTHIASALSIMIEAPLGGCAFNNEFGRPGINGYFRTYLESVPGPEKEELRGFHKPIMIAGGMGTVRPMHVLKNKIQPGANIIVLGGPSMLIGLGGGAASSMASGQSSASLDFASVQRENPEMERRAQMVIDQCCAMGQDSPIVAIHDVGAGGLSNALPELVHDSDLGAAFDLRKVPCDDHSMSPMEIWCNESQERYVLAVNDKDLDVFIKFVERERCPMGIVGRATEEKRLILKDTLLNTVPIDLPMDVLFGKAPKMHRTATSSVPHRVMFSIDDSIPVINSAELVLRLPSVASKKFLITIGDRSVTGLVARDQLVGPWQCPVADVGVILSSPDFKEYSGQAMAMGEKSPLALLSHAASARMAVCESLMNLVAANVDALKSVRLSANWMSAANHQGEGAGIYEAVKAIGLELCPELGITIPVGKDSMSMQTRWDDKVVTAPMSVVITAFGPVKDSRLTYTPRLMSYEFIGDSELVFLDLANQKQRLGGSALAQVYNQIGKECPDIESLALLKSFWKFMQKRDYDNGLVYAYHDRSDGGLLTTILEMCFAGHAGCDLDITAFTQKGRSNVLKSLFNEELGAVIQIKKSDFKKTVDVLSECGFPKENVYSLGCVVKGESITINSNGEKVFSGLRHQLEKTWSETSYRIQSIRDDPVSAQKEFDLIDDIKNPGLVADLKFDCEEDILKSMKTRPRVAILREQGVNSFMELASAFYHAGFNPIDVHMTDILSQKTTLDSFVGLACPGGFSYGDVLGAGTGWAKSILLNKNAKQEFEKFFKRKETFTIGICNGCQMLSQLAQSGIIPGTSHWPNFKKNLSEQFEARVTLLNVSETNNSFWLKNMGGSKIPVAVAHGEGRAEFRSNQDLEKCVGDDLIAVQYLNNDYSIAKESDYPMNPNGSTQSIAGLTSEDGKVFILMPHPERVTRGVSNTWGSYIDGPGFGEQSGWMRLFKNARVWVGEQ